MLTSSLALSPFTRRTTASLAIVAGLLLGAPPMGHATSANDVVITGRVVDVRGRALFGAGVGIEAIALQVGVNESGVYTMTVPARHRGKTLILRARIFGYAPQVRSVKLDSDTIVIDFQLRQDVNRLSQVVVTNGKGAAAASLYNGPQGFSTGAPLYEHSRDLGGESYARITENSFRSPRVAPRSTFGVDVDRASYSNVRRIIKADHQRPPVDAVRIEELINYFPYAYAEPRGEHPIAIRTDVAAAPWAPDHLLVRVGLQTRAIDLTEAPANNLVFLIDVSGSMSSADKLPLLQQALAMLVEQLREQDRVAIVVYAGASGLVLPATSGAEKMRILAAIDRLHPGGSTAGAEGLQLAYKVARKNFIPDGNNRVILATDGDFNVGVTDNAELERMITQRREEGTALTVLGFGAGNIQDDRMEMLARIGNGNYAYIDSRLEARKVLVHELGGTLVTVAKDVKLQVEFNPALVAGYRLLGYENRLLNDEDFKDDKKDAGDMGAGHSVTALYEIIPVGSRDAAQVKLPDSLRYVLVARPEPRSTGELMYVKVRYKQPTDSVSVPMEHAVPNRVAEADEDFRFAQAVAAFGMVLRQSEHKGSATPEMALELANGAVGRDSRGYREDFVELVSAYGRLPRR
ncbi:MAG: von Willebrand factor type A domain-containing protein [Gemmatimonadaceae bacterium]|nr:von Willebrand factor type A domain-containing protein [Gemmatimonadaceae bacterium]